ncbi:hypothetical protein DM02DRAFT_655483 [Periconia macrospinosa]|uniref:Uncharacterized protein n=1 Tax=Periconia macrospinosa TaxID=97972 RepID=A0A2V1DT54_9PLEO|nr:hypothetical protein DM02DRAFT_655483 [Periconia macrospinosa]
MLPTTNLTTPVETFLSYRLLLPVEDFDLDDFARFGLNIPWILAVAAAVGMCRMPRRFVSVVISARGDLSIQTFGKGDLPLSHRGIQLFLTGLDAAVAILDLLKSHIRFGAFKRHSVMQETANLVPGFMQTGKNFRRRGR